MRGKSIVTHCYHCMNKTQFDIYGELEYKIYPDDEEFHRINKMHDEWDQDTADDEDPLYDKFQNYVQDLMAHDGYIRSIRYHQKKTLLVKCVSCSRPSIINVGKNVTYGEMLSDILETQKISFLGRNDISRYDDLDSLQINGYFIDILYPTLKLTPKPSAKMPWQVTPIFEEARAVYNSSPRASAALLRLALEMLLKDLDVPGKNIHERIGVLVKHEFIRETQEALDIIRVIGNNSVHPSEINMDENAETVLKLFDLMNFIVDQLITRRDAIKEIYSKLPEKDKEYIKQRDNKK